MYIWERGGVPWEEEREWEFLGRRRGSGRSLGGGEGVGVPWEGEREWEFLGRRSGDMVSREYMNSWEEVDNT